MNHITIIAPTKKLYKKNHVIYAAHPIIEYTNVDVLIWWIGRLQLLVTQIVTWMQFQ